MFGNAKHSDLARDQYSLSLSLSVYIHISLLYEHLNKSLLTLRSPAGSVGILTWLHAAILRTTRGLLSGRVRHNTVYLSPHIGCGAQPAPYSNIIAVLSRG